MKKIILTLFLSLCLVMSGSLLNESYCQNNEIKTVVLEVNLGSWIWGWGPSIDVDFNIGGTLDFLNGLNLHGSLVIHSNDYLFDIISNGNNDVDFSITGVGFGFGLRYFFGDTGVNGFYLGAKMIMGFWKISGTNGSSGEVKNNYISFAGEIGSRFFTDNQVAINIGLSIGSMSAPKGNTYISNGSSSININKLIWYEIIFAIGVPF